MSSHAMPMQFLHTVANYTRCALISDIIQNGEYKAKTIFDELLLHIKNSCPDCVIQTGKDLFCNGIQTGQKLICEITHSDSVPTGVFPSMFCAINSNETGTHPPLLSNVSTQLTKAAASTPWKITCSKPSELGINLMMAAYIAGGIIATCFLVAIFKVVHQKCQSKMTTQDISVDRVATTRLLE